MPPKTYQNGKVEPSAPIESISRAAGPPCHCQRSGSPCTSRGRHETIPLPGSKLGRQQEHGDAAAPFRFFRFRAVRMARPALGRGFFGTGWGGSAAAERSRSKLAGTRRGFSKRPVLQSGRGRTLLFSAKCCPCPFFMKANLVFSGRRPELFQTRKTADTNQ